MVEKTAADPGAPFMPEVLEALAALKKDDRAAFESLRSQLKKAGLPRDRARRSHRRGKRRYGRARRRAGRHPDRPRADRRTVPYAGRNRLRRSRHQRPSRDLADPRQGLPPLAGAPLLRGDWRRAEFGGAAIGAERDRGQGAFRCAGTRTSISASAGWTASSTSISATKTWRAVEIDATGWRVIDNPPVRFRRASGMKPLPIPAPGGSIETLRSFLNVQIRRRLRAGGRLGAGVSCAIAAPIR